MVDRYTSFAELRAAERAGVDYRIMVCRQDSPVAVIAPHGGTIEPGTSEIASAIAGDDFNLFAFEGLLRSRPHRDLHITSPRFDESLCVEMVAACDHVVAVHGLSGDGTHIDVGGLDDGLRDRVTTALVGAGFEALAVDRGRHAGRDEMNICNRGRRRAGVQLEIMKGLRDRLVRFRNRAALVAFADAIRAAIVDDDGGQ